MGVAKYTVSCLFYLSYEDGKWVVEQDYPKIRVTADDFETALRNAMGEWISFLKNTKDGRYWICLLQKGNQPDWVCADIIKERESDEH